MHNPEEGGSHGHKHKTFE